MLSKPVRSLPGSIGGGVVPTGPCRVSSCSCFRLASPAGRKSLVLKRSSSERSISTFFFSGLQRTRRPPARLPGLLRRVVTPPRVQQGIALSDPSGVGLCCLVLATACLQNERGADCAAPQIYEDGQGLSRSSPSRRSLRSCRCLLSGSSSTWSARPLCPCLESST
jgi:hypothetical protein